MENQHALRHRQQWAAVVFERQAQQIRLNVAVMNRAEARRSAQRKWAMAAAMLAALAVGCIALTAPGHSSPLNEISLNR